MNDNDIIKALRQCVAGGSCRHCPLEEEVGCRQKVLAYALETINSQKTEIERLKRYDEERDVRLHARLTETARAEAIKEFAERLKQTRVDFDGIEMVAVGNIDTILEQMTEE